MRRRIGRASKVKKTMISLLIALVLVVSVSVGAVLILSNRNNTPSTPTEPPAPTKTSVNLPSVQNIKTVVTNWDDFTSKGFYYTKDIPLGYNVEKKLTVDLNVALDENSKNEIKIYTNSSGGLVFASDYKMMAPKSCDSLFKPKDALKSWNLTKIIFNNFDTSKTTSIRTMFNMCSGVTTLDLSSWDIGSVTENLGTIFYCCNSLTEIKGIENWVLSDITEYHETFSHCNFTTLNLSSLNTRKVTSFSGMFLYTFAASSGTLIIGDDFVINGEKATKATLQSVCGLSTSVKVMRNGVELTV